MRQLRVPYRIGYTAIVAYRFLPRFGAELARIRQAQRVRGVARGRWPIASAHRASAAIVPLRWSPARSAAHPTRTERHPTPWRVRDTAFVLLFWLASAGLFARASAMGPAPPEGALTTGSALVAGLADRGPTVRGRLEGGDGAAQLLHLVIVEVGEDGRDGSGTVGAGP